MDLGICVASHIGDTDYVVRAEELGYTHAWLADSQMLWSDCYATLAVAAYRTSRIKLGTGGCRQRHPARAGERSRYCHHQRLGTGAHLLWGGCRKHSAACDGFAATTNQTVRTVPADLGAVVERRRGHDALW